jgi:hypothetical protein
MQNKVAGDDPRFLGHQDPRHNLGEISGDFLSMTLTLRALSGWVSIDSQSQ